MRLAINTQTLKLPKKWQNTKILTINVLTKHITQQPSNYKALNTGRLIAAGPGDVLQAADSSQTLVMCSKRPTHRRPGDVLQAADSSQTWWCAPSGRLIADLVMYSKRLTHRRPGDVLQAADSSQTGDVLQAADSSQTWWCAPSGRLIADLVMCSKRPNHRRPGDVLQAADSSQTWWCTPSGRFIADLVMCSKRPTHRRPGDVLQEADSSQTWWCAPRGRLIADLVMCSKRPTHRRPGDVLQEADSSQTWWCAPRGRLIADLVMYSKRPTHRRPGDVLQAADSSQDLVMYSNNIHGNNPAKQNVFITLNCSALTRSNNSKHFRTFNYQSKWTATFVRACKALVLLQLHLLLWPNLMKAPARWTSYIPGLLFFIFHFLTDMFRDLIHKPIEPGEHSSRDNIVTGNRSHMLLTCIKCSKKLFKWINKWPACRLYILGFIRIYLCSEPDFCLDIVLQKWSSSSKTRCTWTPMDPSHKYSIQ